MATKRTLIPFAHYTRAFRVMSPVIELVEMDPGRSCQFFSVVGAEILRKFYGKDASPVAGATVLCLDGRDLDGLIIGELVGDELQSSDSPGGGFHCWVECEGYAIDFMAPLFGEYVSGISKCPRRMFQRRLGGMCGSLDDLHVEGDFYLLRNLDLTNRLFESFMTVPAHRDLLEVCVNWYEKPPTEIRRTIQVLDDLGHFKELKLATTEVTGAW